jgi:hypothetical protein
VTPGSHPIDRRMQSLSTMRPLPLQKRCDEPLARVGDSWIWACEACKKPIHDLSMLSEAEATAWLQQNAGERRCIKFSVDGQGRLVFAAAVAAISAAACSAADWDAAYAKLNTTPSPPTPDASEIRFVYGFVELPDLDAGARPKH